MKISIITAIYNRDKTIARALESIKSQLHEDVELVVIDGSSTDGSVRTIEGLIGTDDKFISEPDKGIYDALNKGIKYSTGEILGFLHSDDFLAHNLVLSKVNDLFYANCADIVYGDASFFAKNQESKVVRTYRSGPLSVKRLAWGWMPAHPAIFLRRSVFNLHGDFNTDYMIAADYAFLCRIAADLSLRVVYTPEVLVQMQLGGVSTGGLRNTILLNREVLRACRENGIYSNILMILSKYPMKALQFLLK
jgi:glycosyltransferase involved in cell wall biosynthesis